MSELLDPRTCTHPDDKISCCSNPWVEDRLFCSACGAPVRWDSRPRAVLKYPEAMVAQAPPIQAATPEHVALHSIAQALKVSGQAHEVGTLAVQVIQERDKLSTERAAIAKIIGRVNYPIGELTKHVQGVWNDAVQYGEYVTRAKETFVQIRAVFNEPEATTFDRIVELVQSAQRGWVDVNESRAERDAAIAEKQPLKEALGEVMKALGGVCLIADIGTIVQKRLEQLRDERDRINAERNATRADRDRIKDVADRTLAEISGIVAGDGHDHLTYGDTIKAVKAVMAELADLRVRNVNAFESMDKLVAQRDQLQTEVDTYRAQAKTPELDAGRVRQLEMIYKSAIDQQNRLMTERDALAAKEPTRAYAEGLLHDIQMALGLTNTTPRSELATKAREAMDRGDRAWATIHAIAAALGLTTWRADELPVVARDLKAASAQPPRRWNAGSLVQRLMSEYPGNPSPSVIARALVLLGAIDS
jgi:hypothetical protein